jgi:hypothetical protein
MRPGAEKDAAAAAETELIALSSHRLTDAVQGAILLLQSADSSIH